MGPLNGMFGRDDDDDADGRPRSAADATTDGDETDVASVQPGQPVIEAEGLHYEYPDGTVGLDTVELTLRAGERVAVIGPNGSGKSTLQQLLGGLVEPTRGSVTYFGETADAEAVRGRLGVLLQDPDDYLFNTTVREDVEYGPAQLGVPQAEAEARTERLAETLGLTDLLDQPPFRLSGGEKQRAALASVLAFDPEILLLDEPTSAVDGDGRERIFDLLDDLHGSGKTVVTFTPDLELVPRIADRVILVGPAGTVAAAGSVREVLTDAALLRENDLQPPAVTRLFAGLDVDEVPLTVEEARDVLERSLD